jgi:hypothetical protein
MKDLGARLIKIHGATITPGVDFAFDQDTEEITAWKESKLGPPPADLDELDSNTAEAELEIVKIEKKQEIAQAAIDEMAAVYTEGIEGRDELQYELTKAIIAIGQALGITEITNNVKLQEVVRCGTKARQKQIAIEAADTVAQVESVEWEPG